MKKSIMTALMFTAAVAFSSNAFAGEGIYIKAIGGYINNQYDESASSGGTTVSLDGEDGYVAGAAIGRDYGMFRAEAEVAYRETDFDLDVTSGAATVSGGGDLSALTFMVNGYYDFENSSSFTPYIGAGIGVGQFEVDDVTIGGTNIGGEDETDGAYQGMIGVNYNATEQLDLGVEYRYFNSFDDENFGGSHEGLVGVTYSFN